MILGGDEHRCSCSNCDSHCNSNSDGPGPKNNNFSWKESEDSSIGDLVTDSLSHFWFWTSGNLIFMTIVTTKNLTGDHLQFLRCLQAFYGNHYLHKHIHMYLGNDLNMLTCPFSRQCLKTKETAKSAACLARWASSIWSPLKLKSFDVVKLRPQKLEKMQFWNHIIYLAMSFNIMMRGRCTSETCFQSKYISAKFSLYLYGTNWMVIAGQRHDGQWWSCQPDGRHAGNILMVSIGFSI